MEFVEGQPLVTILHEEGKLPVDWTLHVLEQSADGLSAAHRAGVVHRDIKPGNLMVRPDGVVKLTDFGIAQARDATPLTRTGMVVGTAQYLSPEQAQGMEVNAASDVYSLGIVAYECLTGGRPFDGTSQVAIALAHINRQPPPLPPEVPPAVRLLVERALAKDPADRFPDGGAFADAVRRVAAGGTPTPLAVPVGPFDGPDAGRRRRLRRREDDGPRRADRGADRHPGPLPRDRCRRPDAPAAGAGDDDDWLADDAGPAPAKRRRWPWLLAGLLAPAARSVAATFLLLNQGDGDDGGRTADPTTTSSSSSAPAAGVAIGCGRRLRRPRRRRGARPSWRRWACGCVEEAGRRRARSPSWAWTWTRTPSRAIVPAGHDRARRGSEVTLIVAEDGWTVEEERAGGGAGPGPQTTEPTAPTTTDAPTTTSSSSSSPQHAADHEQHSVDHRRSPSTSARASAPPIVDDDHRRRRLTTDVDPEASGATTLGPLLRV